MRNCELASHDSLSSCLLPDGSNKFEVGNREINHKSRVCYGERAKTNDCN